MKDFSLWIIAIIIAIAMVLAATGYSNDSAARRAYAQAAMVREQAQARSDLLAAMLPYVIFGSVVIVCAALAAIVIYALARRPDMVRAEPVRVIERQMIIMIQPGQSRREVYQMLSGGRNDETIPL